MAKGTSHPTMTSAQRTGLRNLGARNTPAAMDLKTARMNPGNSSIYKTLMQGPAPKGSRTTTKLRKAVGKGIQRNHS